ncbi:MAG TPA: response regulator transcription factor [Sandaracinaceae bacterium LLY-WYZ-13_1]|nr:response regulator transcription factor [Sandaracinaceae bacterium LLY-WYZ-13_1]
MSDGTADILVVDDDTELCELLEEYLAREGFTVEAVHDGESGLERATAGGHRLIVLDVMLPALNGFDVLRRLRASSSVPVLMLTARGQDVDRIVGLEMGADDYLPKPFNPRELVARIRAIHRRAEHAVEAEVEVLTVDDLELHVASRAVLRDGEELSLTTAELGLLEALLRGLGRVVSREELSEQVLGRRFSPYDRSIDVHVSNLRKKLGPGPGGRERIKTVRGHGYLYAMERRG